jgi:hypothetical protein
MHIYHCFYVDNQFPSTIYSLILPFLTDLYVSVIAMVSIWFAPPYSCKNLIPPNLMLMILRGEKLVGVVAQACNLSYSGGGDQEECGLRPAQAKSS